MPIHLTDRDRTLLRNLIQREWNLLDRMKDESVSHNAYSGCVTRMTELDALADKLTISEPVAP